MKTHTPKSTSQPSMKNTRKPRRILATSVAALVALCVLPMSARAGQVWDGDTDGNWATATNWDANTLPNFAVGLQFAGVANLITTNNAATATVAGITFNAGAGAFTLGGNAVTLSNGITVNSVNTQTISFLTTGVTLGNSQLWNAASGSLNVTSAVALGAFTLTIDGANSTTIGGAITSAAGSSLIKNGTGTLAINNASASVTGNVNINAGSLFIGAAGNLTTAGTVNVAGTTGGLTGTGTITGNVNVTSTLNASAFAGVIAGAATTLTVNNPGAGGAFRISGLNTYGGLTTVTAGFLEVSGVPGTLGSAAAGTVVANGGTLGLSGANIGSGETLQITGAGTTNFSPTVLGALFAEGAGVSTYGGAITVTGGGATIGVVTGTTLNLTGGISKSGQILTLTSVTAAGGILNINTTGISGAAANSDVIIDNGLVTNWNAANTYNGATFIRNGSTLSANVANALPTVNGRTALSLDDSGAGGSFLLLKGADQAIRSLASPVATSTVNLSADGSPHVLTIGDSNATSTTFAGKLTGAGGGITKDTDGSTLTISNPLNDYTGPTKVTGGTLKLGNSNVIPDLSAVTVTGANTTLDLQTFTDTVASLTLQNGGKIIGTGTITSIAPYDFQQGLVSANLGGTFAPGTPAINKTTVGTVTLTGNNTFTGVTNVLAGILEAGSNTALGAGGAGNGTVVTAGGTLRLLNTVSIPNEPLTINGAGAAGASGAFELAAGGGAATFGGAITVLSNSAISSNGGTLTLNGNIDKTDVNLTLNGGAVGGGRIVINGSITGNLIGFNDDLIVDSVTTDLNAPNSYVGNTFIRTTVAAGTLNANVLNALPNSTAANFNLRTTITMNDGVPSNAATLNLNNGFFQAVQWLSSPVDAGAIIARVNLQNSTLFIGNLLGVGDIHTFGGVITGGPLSAVIKEGSNTQILTGVNTYTGQTRVASGTLQIGNGVAVGAAIAPSVPIIVDAAGTLDIRLLNGETFSNGVTNNGLVRGINTAGNTQTLSGVITGTGVFIQNAGGKSIFTNINTYQGGTAISAASTVQVGNAAFAGSVGTGDVTVSAASFLTLINVNGNVLPNNVKNNVAGLGTVISTPAFAVSTTLSGALTEAGAGNTLALVHNGFGTTILTNAGNNYTGTTTVSLGTLQIGTVGNTSSPGANTAANTVVVGNAGILSLVNINGNTLNNNITNTLGGAGLVNVNSANNNTLAGALTGGAGTLALTQSGTGTTTLTSAANALSAATTISAGNLIIGTAALPSRFDAAGATAVNMGTGGILTLVNLVGNTLANNITNTLGGTAQVTVNSANNNTLSGVLSNGLGTLALTQSGAGTTTLTGANTYTGNTLVTLGHLVIGNGATGNLNVGSAVTVNAGAFLDLNLVNGGIFANNVLDNGTVQGINTAGNTQTVSGIISGLGSFNQNAGGTTIFTNVNTYAGTTNISAASIIQVGTAALAGSVGTGAVSVSAGSAFNLVNLSGNALANNVSNTVAGAGTVNVNSVNTNTLSGAYTDGGGFTLALAQNGTGTTIMTNAANAYNGGTKVLGGVLQIGTTALASTLGNNIAANTVSVGTGGTLTLVNLAAGSNPLLNNITNAAGGAGTVNVNSVNLVQIGSGAGGSLTNGAGTLALIQSNLLGTTILGSAGNTYGGGTTVSAGTLQVGTAALASSLGANVAGNTVSVGNGATLAIVNLIAGANPMLNNITNNLAGTGLVNVNSANANTVAGILSNGAGTLALTQSGAGTTTLTGVNTYTGATTVAGGTLQVGNGAIGSISGSSPVTVNATGTLDVNLLTGTTFANTVLNNGAVRGINAAGTTETFSGVISGLGSFSQISGTGIFTNVNTYAGGTTINGPTTTLQIGTGVSAAAAGSGNINVNGGSTLTLVNVSGNLLSNNLTNTAGGIVGTVLANSALTMTLSGSIKDGTAPMQLTQSGTGTTILTNVGNTYTGPTKVSAGILQVGTLAQAGSIGVASPIDVGSTGTLSLFNLVGNTLANGISNNTFGGTGFVNVNSANNNTLSGALTNGAFTLALTQTGTGTTILTNAANTYTGPTTITAGALQVGNGGATGSLGAAASAVTNNALLAFNVSGPLLIGNAISGTGNVSQIGAGTTSLTGANTYTGTTLITTGALSVGNGGAAGTLGVGAVTDNASLIFNRSDAFTVANAIGGTGTVTQQGTGVTTLSGASNYTGATTVAFGNLRVDGSLGTTAVTVNSGATLSGKGSIAGSVNILGGGNLNPGTSPGTITFGSLVLNPLSNSNFELGVPGVIGQAVLPGNDLVNVTGNLTIDGILNVTPIAGFGPGSYRLFNYGGVLTNNIIDTITGAPAGSTIVTGVAGQVNLLVLNAGAGLVQFWDGAGVPNDGTIAGGNGNWDNFQNNWTNAAGTVNAAWQNGTATFGAAAGTVTLTNTINAQGLAFTTTGYVVNGLGGFTLNLVGPAPAPTITVSAGLNATINAQITGANGLTADGTGTLFLTNVGNSYTGGTAINGGTVSVSNDGSLGAAAGGLSLNAGTLQATSTFASARTIVLAGAGTIDVTGANTFTESGVISGAAGFALNKTGTGTLNLTNAANSYLGGTVIQNGTLQIANNTNLGNVAGGITFGGTAGNNPILQTLAGIVSARAVTLNASGGTFDTNGFNSTLSGVIGGAAGNNFTKIGAGTLTVTGTSTYLGATNVNAGTLQVGDGATAGSQIGNATATVNVNSGGILLVNLANGGTFNNPVTVNAGGSVNTAGLLAVNSQTILGVISGAGIFNQNSPGTTIITGVNTYTGATNVNTGTLQVGNGLTGNLSAVSLVNVAGGAILDVKLGTGQTLGSNIVNAGTINATDAAGLTQTLSGVISGAGTFNQTGTGITNLTGASTYIGATNVNAGTLRVNGSLGNTLVTVASGATLGGSGTIAGNVTVVSGGILAPGNSAGTLTIGNLVLNAGANSNYELATPGVIGSGVNDLVNVTNNLTLDGNLNLTAVAPPFGSGSYRIFNYGGVLTNNFIDSITGVPAGFTATVVTGVLHEVNLLVLSNALLAPAQFWDGAHADNTTIEGGNGNWDNFNNNWTNAAGTTNSAWLNGTASFGATAGTVTIVAPINAQGLIFTSSGYVINGSGGFGLNLVGPANTISVSAAGQIATINAQITSNAGVGLNSNGPGTLILTNVGNSYTGGTTISGGGTVSISSDANLGASGAGNGITFNGGTLQATSTFTLATARAITLTGAGTIDVTASNTLTYGGVASGAGALSKTGTGTLNLTGINLYTGGTSILGGTLQVSNDNNLGGVAGGLTFANNATLQTLVGIVSARAVTLNVGGGTIDTNGFNSTFSGVIGGAGSLTKINAGTLLLTGVETYTGPTNINGGILQIGNGATGNLAAASVVNVNNGGTFAVNLLGGTTLASASIVDNLGGTVTGINAAGTQTISGVISGLGVVNQNGAGTTVLTGVNTYTGSTSALVGTLQIGNGATGSISNLSAVSVSAGANLALNLATGTTFANNVFDSGTVIGLVAGANTNIVSGSIFGPGGFNQNGTGTTFLTGFNTYTGATNVTAGTLQIGNGVTGIISPASTPVNVSAGATLALNLANGTNFTNAIVDNGTVNLLVAAPNTNTVSGAISGAGVVTHNGTGTTTLSGANSYTGLTTVFFGELDAGSNTALGTIAAGTVVNAGATLRLLNGVAIGAEALTINGTGVGGTAGALTGAAGGAESYAGPVTLGSNSTVNANGGTMTFTGGFIKTGFNLTFTGGGTIVVNGAPISGNSGLFNSDLIVNGTTTTLVTANTYLGKTFIRSIAAGDGTLNANGVNALPTLFGRTSVTMDDSGAGGSKLNLGASQSIASLAGIGSSLVNLNANTLTIGFGTAPDIFGTAGANFAGVISGAGGITKNEGSTQIFSGLNTYTGATTVSGGTLQAASLQQSFGVNSATTVNAGGTLELADFSQTIGSLSGAGTVQNTLATNPALPVLVTLTIAGQDTSVVPLALNGAFSGAINQALPAAPLQVVKNGIGTESLSGQSNYTGGTVLNAGTLNIDASSLPGSGSNPPATGPIGRGLLTINGGTIGTTSNTAGATNNDVANNVQINSNFSVTSAGGANFVGGPVISDGVSFSGPVNLGASVTINTISGFLDLTGVVSDGGFVRGLTFTGNSFSLIGAGFAGEAPNTYTGLTIVNGGLVLLNKGAFIPGADGVAIKGNIQVDAGALLQVNSNFLSGGTTANNQIARTANALVNGTLDIGGTNQTLNTLTGNGRVELSDNAVNMAFAAAPGTIGGILTVNSGNFAGVIRDSGLNGQLVKNTGGILILTGNNTYVGNTTINAGTLQVDGSIASKNTLVNLGGTLSGVGVVGGNVINGGIVTPGHSIGTLTVKGNYTQTPAGTLIIEIAGKGAGQHDLLAVGGSASLNGNLRLVKLGALKLKVGDQVTFLTAAGGVSGKFSNISNPFSTGNTIVQTGVVYHSNFVALEAQQGSFADFINGTDCGPNGLAVGKALDKVASNTKASKLINFLNGEPLGALCSDFDKIAPEELASIFNIGISLANVQTSNLERRMDDIQAGSTGFSAGGYAMGGVGPIDRNDTAYGARGPEGKGGKEMRAPEDNRWGVFVTGVGEFTNIGNTANARGYDMTTGGFTIGVDYKLTPNFAIGINTGYARTGADLTGNGRVDVDGAKLGVYATYFTGTGFYVDAAVNGGYNSYDTQRGALKGRARGSTEGGEINALFATGYDWKTGGLRIGPTASVQYTNVSINGFREHGSLAPLRFTDQSGESLRTALGMKASYDWQVGGVVIRPEVRAAWQHEFGDSSFALQSRFASGAGNTFTVRGPEIGEDSLLLGTGVAVLWNERTSTYVYYDGEIGRTNYSSNNVSGGVRMSF